MSGTHPAALDESDLLADCDVRRLRRSGPGGQHRNKVETAVQLVHRPTGVSAEANERRSARENQRVAVRRLRLRLALAVRSEPSSARETPSPLWKSRCRNRRISVSPSHVDFPALLAEVFDVLHEHAFDAKSAAGQLDVSSSQLVRFLKDEPAAFEMLNRRREDAGLHRYK